MNIYRHVWTNSIPLIGNHAGYRQLKGTRATADEITALYEGLCQSHLTDFDVMLSGYTPSAAAVEAVGAIGQDLQRKAEKKPGSFFWGRLISFLISCLIMFNRHSSFGSRHGGPGSSLRQRRCGPGL